MIPNSSNKKLEQYNYYSQPQSYSVSEFVQTQKPKRKPRPHKHPDGPCMPIQPGLQATVAAPWEKAVAEHNLDAYAHPHLLKLFKDKTSLYYCKDTIASRDAISMELREIGLMVYVSETDTLYRLENGIENEDWMELNVNSDRVIKLGRLNPPPNPEDGLTYFDLSAERLKVFILGSWVTIPNQTDIATAIMNHDSDMSAHSELFEEVENKWLII